MKRFILLLSLIVGFKEISAQSEKNYIIEIDGDSVFASLDEPTKFVLKDGKNIVIKVRKKEFLAFQKGPVSFNYPSKYSVASKAIDEDVDLSSLLPHHQLKPWEEIYRNWPKNDALQYFWESEKLKIKSEE